MKLSTNHTESSSETESSEKENVEQKRRKVGGGDIGSSIERSVSVLAQTLQSCEEQRGIRHQQLMELHKRQLQIEESRNQLHRQGIADLVSTLAGFGGIHHRSEGYGGEEISQLKKQNEAMQAELITIKTELSQLREQLPSLLRTMMHNMFNTMHPSTSHSQHPHSMDPSGSGGDA